MENILWTVLYFLSIFIAFLFCIFFSFLIVKILTISCEWIGFILHYIYWKWKIWWNGWEFEVPDYWNEFDVDEYIDNLLELEMGYMADGEQDIDVDSSFYVVVINPNGEICIGKAFMNTN